jgi:hypothetical protein
MTHPTEASVGSYMNELNEFHDWVVAGTTQAQHSKQFYALLLRNPETHEKVAIWFYSDDEGNQPGSFVIETLKEAGA